MTETQAKSGAAGTSTNPVEQEPAEGAAPAAGRAVVGRATVPDKEPAGTAGTSQKFTRAPGMAPPPERPPVEPDRGTPEQREDSAAGTIPVAQPAPMIVSAHLATGKAQVSAPPLATQGHPAVMGPAGGGPGTPTIVGPPGSAPTRPGLGRPGVGRPGLGRPAVGAARVTEAVRAARNTVSAAAARGPRRARLNVKRIDPWSVMKFSFAVSLVLFIVVIVATSVLYLALDAMGVFESVNSTLSDMIGATGGSGFKITAKGVIGTSALVGAVNVVLFTALATLAAFIYNVCADLVGGIEVTLSERD